MKYKTTIFIIIFLFSIFYFPLSDIKAFDSGSTHFKIQAADIQSISGEGSSTNFKVRSAGGQIATGISTNIKKIYSGILYWLTGVTITVCGNGIREGNEQCDNGGSNGACPATCSTSCTINFCGGGGGIYIPTPETKVIIQGIAYPGVDVTILKDGQIILTTKADSSANFKAEISGITAGIWTFGLWAEDNKGRRPQIYSFTVNISSGMITTISNIFLPPTIDLTEDRVVQGDKIGILGQSAPQSEVSIYVYSSAEPLVKKIKTDSAGAYFYNLDTSPLEIGQHSTKSKSTNMAGLVSGFSKTLTFQVLSPKAIIPPPRPTKCIPANLNCDFDKKGKDIVNIIDVSILLYNWGKLKNPRADLNKDGVVNLKDFSILLYYWTG